MLIAISNPLTAILLLKFISSSFLQVAAAELRCSPPRLSNFTSLVEALFSPPSISTAAGASATEAAFAASLAERGVRLTAIAAAVVAAGVAETGGSFASSPIALVHQWDVSPALAGHIAMLLSHVTTDEAFAALKGALCSCLKIPPPLCVPVLQLRFKSAQCALSGYTLGPSSQYTPECDCYTSWLEVGPMPGWASPSLQVTLPEMCPFPAELIVIITAHLEANTAASTTTDWSELPTPPAAAPQATAPQTAPATFVSPAVYSQHVRIENLAQHGGAAGSVQFRVPRGLQMAGRRVRTASGQLPLSTAATSQLLASTAAAASRSIHGFGSSAGACAVPLSAPAAAATHVVPGPRHMQDLVADIAEPVSEARELPSIAIPASANTLTSVPPLQSEVAALTGARVAHVGVPPRLSERQLAKLQALMGDACQAEIDRLSVEASRLSPPSSLGALGIAQPRVLQGTSHPTEPPMAVPCTNDAIPVPVGSTHQSGSLLPAAASSSAAAPTTTAVMDALTVAATTSVLADNPKVSPDPSIRPAAEEDRGISTQAQVPTLPMRASAERISGAASQKVDTDHGKIAVAHLPERPPALGSVPAPRMSPEKGENMLVESGSVYVDALEEGSTQPGSQYSDAMASPPPEGSQQLLGGDDEVLLDVTDTLDIIQLAGLVIEPTSLVALTRESVQGPGMVEEGARVGEGSAGVTAVCPKPCETAVGTVHVVRQSAGNSERNAAADVEALQLQL